MSKLVKFDKNTKTWTSCGNPSMFVYNTNVSLSHIMLRLMEMHGPKIAQISDDTKERFTYEQMRQMTIRAAQNLQARGYGSKQVVGIVARDVPHLIPIVFAQFCLGNPMNIMNMTFKDDMKRMLQISEPQLMFCEMDRLDLLVECLEELQMNPKIFTFNGTKSDLEPVECLFTPTGNEDDYVPAEVDGNNETAFIMSTSGSTGPAKGFCVSHAYLFIGMHSIYVNMYKDGVIFNPSTLSWIIGVMTVLHTTMCGSTRIVTCEEFSIEQQLRLINEYKLTLIDNVPNDLIEMLKSGLLPKANLSSLRHVIVGGYKVPLAILEKFNAWLPNETVHNLYGMTELGDVSIDPGFSGRDSVGQLVNGVTVKIVDENGDRCGVNMRGELCVKPKYKILGYHKNKQLTDACIDDEGFFMTGDIAYLDEDGYLYVVDRKKFIILHPDGNWVYPVKIEECLIKSPEIKKACVVSVPFDDIFEVPAAAILRENGSKITEDDVHQMVKDNMPKECELRGGVYFFDSIPSTRTGKHKRKAIKDNVLSLYKSKHSNKKS